MIRSQNCHGYYNIMDLLSSWNKKECKTNCIKQNIKSEPAKWRAQRAHAPCVSYVAMCLTCPMCSTCPTCQRALLALRAHVPKYILHTGKLKTSILMKSNESSFTDVFKSTEF